MQKIGNENTQAYQVAVILILKFLAARGVNLQVRGLNKVNLQTKLNALKAFLSSYSKGSRSLYHCGVPLQVINLFQKLTTISNYWGLILLSLYQV